MDIIKNKNYLVVSRGSTAIYLILKTNDIVTKKVLVPANICYAAVYPIIYAGYFPVFCDVSEITGNVTFEIVSKYADEVGAMIIPHMFGNPVSDISKIKEMCNNKHILLIEDCASAMGAELNGTPCGSFGDYAVFSTGYSKTIDIGYGGIIVSERNIDYIAEEYKKLPAPSKLDHANSKFFSKLYRLIRNNAEQSLSQYIWKSLEPQMNSVFVHYLNGIDDKVIGALNGLEGIVERRRNDYCKYLRNVNINDSVSAYKFEKGAVPWRANFFVDPCEKKDLIYYLLKKDVPVSDWYPVVTPIFNVPDTFESAGKFDQCIINFPIPLPDNEIKRICKVLNSFRSFSK